MHSIQDGAHRILANAEVHVASANLQAQSFQPINIRMGAWTKVCRTTHHLRQTRTEDLDHLS